MDKLKKQYKIKLVVLFISLAICGLMIYLFFADTSLEWGTLKIISCIIASIWSLFILPTVVYFICKIKNSGMEYSFKVGYQIGSGSLLGILIAPYYGIKFYFANLDEIKYQGEIICYSL